MVDQWVVAKGRPSGWITQADATLAIINRKIIIYKHFYFEKSNLPEMTNIAAYTIKPYAHVGNPRAYSPGLNNSWADKKPANNKPAIETPKIDL